MIIATAQITLRIPWAHSLKDKRMVLRSLLSKMREKFNVSVTEVGNRDAHQLAVLGIASVVADTAQADSTLDHILCFVENRTDAEIVGVERELR